MTTQTYFGTLVVTDCCTCGIYFGMTRELWDRRLDDGGRFYCPSGHWQVFIEPVIPTLEAKLKRAEARRVHAEDQARAAERSAASVRGHLTRLRNRIANGVCPWCRRSFKNVHDHVRGQHPEHLDKLKAASA